MSAANAFAADAPTASEGGGSLEEIRPGRRLHVASRHVGADLTLFFVHGGGGNKEQWRLQWRALHDAGCDLLAADAIGHGRSARPDHPAAYDGTELVADARAVLARARTARTVVVAHSYGARVALALLGEGARVHGLVLLAPMPAGRRPARRLPATLLGHLPVPLLEWLRPLLGRGFRRRAWHPDADPDLVGVERQATRNNSLFVLRALLLRPPAVDPARLERLQVPILLLAGEQDGIVPPQAVAGLAALLPGAELREIPRCGHQIMLEHPDETLRAIRDVVGAVRRAPVD